jgi:hypothetical protein
VERPPLLGRHHEVCVGDLADAADVVLVQVGDDRGGHVGGAIAEPLEARREGLVLFDLEPRETAVDEPDGTIREVARVGHRRSILAGVEQNDAVAVLDDVDVDRAACQPPSRDEDPPVHRRASPIGVLGVDVDRAGAEPGDTGDVRCHGYLPISS